MDSYDGHSVDHYMRTTLEQDLDDHEVDNALTVLTALTTVAPDTFPHHSTFVRANKLSISNDISIANGVTLYAVKGGKESTSLFLPRPTLRSLKLGLNAMFSALDNGLTLADL